MGWFSLEGQPSRAAWTPPQQSTREGGKAQAASALGQKVKKGSKTQRSLALCALLSLPHSTRTCHCRRAHLLGPQVTLRSAQPFLCLCSLN